MLVPVTDVAKVLDEPRMEIAYIITISFMEEGCKDSTSG